MGTAKTHLTCMQSQPTNHTCILACTGLVGASRKSPCSVIIIIIIT